MQNWDATGDDGVFESNMTLCIEAFIGRAGGDEGVKFEEHVILTDDGVERLSQNHATNGVRCNEMTFRPGTTMSKNCGRWFVSTSQLPAFSQECLID